MSNPFASLAFQNKAPSVAKAAAAELLERKAPKTKNVDQGLTAADVRRVCDIYERIFGTETKNVEPDHDQRVSECRRSVRTVGKQ